MVIGKQKCGIGSTGKVLPGTGPDLRGFSRADCTGAGHCNEGLGEIVSPTSRQGPIMAFGGVLQHMTVV